MLNHNYLKIMLNCRPSAKAIIKGNEEYSQICGNVYFYETKDGVLLNVAVNGLPSTADICGSRVFGFHIHEGDSCTGNASDPFADTKTHYNPYKCNHPFHAGDLPPLFENNGTAFMAFVTRRFTVCEVLGRTILIHDMPDDFKSQPSGDSGIKIACGLICS